MHKITKVIANVYDGDSLEDTWSMDDITERIALEDRNA